MRRRAVIERELASRVYHRTSIWLGHVERIDKYRMARTALMTEISGGRLRGRPRLGVKVTLSSRRMTVPSRAQVAYHMERGGMPLHNTVGVNYKREQLLTSRRRCQVYWLRSKCWMIVRA